MLLTDPDEAADFVRKTQVDALAIAIGTSHGAYKFTRKPTGQVLRIDRVKDIHQRIPNIHLVMHGSSSVPEDWAQMINDYGGDIGQTYGVPVEEIVEGIRHGVRKVNIDTDLRIASWRHAQVHGRRQEELRPAQALQGRANRHDRDLPGPLRGLRRRRPGRQAQAPAPGGDELGVCPGRTRSDRPLARRAERARKRRTRKRRQRNASDAI
ncbi:class II fructose-bisphosphate aldolase [Methylococcus sp. Mc7]|uniref:class II fructose-bisphosphate aldolase n=1 Tax=Methylococcus sp. Mc7 TaxID=2860258 RepID=UPI00351D1BDE